MGLISEFKLLLAFGNVVDVLVLFNCVLVRGTIARLAPLVLLGVDLRLKVGMVSEKFLTVNLRDGVDGDVGSFVLEATVHVDVGVNGPARVTETLDCLELVPLGGFGVVNFESDVFTDLVSTSTDDDHKRTEEQSGVLVARSRNLTSLVRGLHPVPAAVTMATKSPSVSETALVGSATTEAYHHAGGTASLAEGSRVVHSRRRRIFTAIELVPREGRSFDTQAPNVINWLLAGVSTVDQKMRLGEDNCVSVSAAGSGSDHGHDHPLCHVLTVSHVEQVQIITCQAATTCGSTVDNHLHLFDVGR